GLSQVRLGAFRETGPGEHLSQAIPGPGAVWQALGGAFVGEADPHEGVLVGRFGTASAHSPTEGANAKRASDDVALGEHQPAFVAATGDEVAGAAGRLGGAGVGV